MRGFLHSQRNAPTGEAARAISPPYRSTRLVTIAAGALHGCASGARLAMGAVLAQAMPHPTACNTAPDASRTVLLLVTESSHAHMTHHAF